MEHRYALISVYDKEGIVDFSKGLTELGIRILSTGGTAAVLEKAGIPFTEVSEVTGFPEMLDGRVKTLHPIIHAGILARRDNKEHLKTLKEHQINRLILLSVTCILLKKPYKNQTSASKKSLKTSISVDQRLSEQLQRTTKMLSWSPVQNNIQKSYPALKSKKGISLEHREKLAIQAYAHTAQYDAMIAQYLRNRWTDELLPQDFSVTMRKIQEMRYGENPHQKGAFYKSLPPTDEPCIATAEQLQGKELSFNNILDANCAIECIKEFREAFLRHH